jgi:hypothetical protein
MNWQREIGVDSNLLQKVDPSLRDRQIFVFSLLSIMLVIVGFICTFSTLIYTMIIFHSWIIAIGSAIFLGLVSFNVYRMLVMTAMDAYGTVLGEYMRDHEQHYFEHIQREQNFEELKEEEILDFVSVSKQKLRENNLFEKTKKGMKFSEVMTMSIRVIILSLLAITFATGIEIFIFRDKINEILNTLSQVYSSNGGNWVLENILMPAPNDEFFIINSNSLLLVIEVLNKGLGNWKILIDLMFLVVFLIPLALVFRSKEVRQGEYIKEMILNMVSITFYHYIHTQKHCQKIYSDFKTSVGIYRVSKREADSVQYE